MKNYIKKGSIPAHWDDSYKNLEYIRQPIKQEEVDKWREMGYNHNTFSGVMYGGKNIMPEWVYDVSKQIGLANPGFVLYKMSCMEVMPPHLDHFETYSRVFGIPKDKVYRGLVMLEDWKPGHYLEMDRIGYVNWNAGDYFVWSSDVEHAASNIGSEPRWTLQITGTLIEQNKDT